MAFTDTELSALEGLIASGNERAIRNVIGDEHAVQAFAVTVVKAVRGLAREKTGGVVLGAVGGLMSRMGMVVMLGGLVYALGGWAAIAKLWALLGREGA